MEKKRSWLGRITAQLIPAGVGLVPLATELRAQNRREVISTDRASVSSFYSNEEIQSVLSGLKDWEVRAIQKRAEKEIRRFPYEYWSKYDLVQEAIFRLINGRRKWPRSKDAVQFFCGRGLLRSLVSNELKKMQFVDEFDEEHITGPPGSSVLDAHQVLEDEQRRSRVISAFDDHPGVQSLVILLIAGYKKPEIMEKLALDAKAYEAAVKMIRRRVSALDDEN